MKNIYCDICKKECTPLKASQKYCQDGDCVEKANLITAEKSRAKKKKPEIEVPRISDAWNTWYNNKQGTFTEFCRKNYPHLYYTKPASLWC